MVLAGVLIIKELLFRHVDTVGDSTGSLAVKTDAWHHGSSDALTSAFAFMRHFQARCLEGEDGRPRMGGRLVCAALLILYNVGEATAAWGFWNFADVAPDVEPGRKSESDLQGGCRASWGLDKCVIRKMGFIFYVDLHIVVNGEMTVREGHAGYLAQGRRQKFAGALPQVAEVLVHAEPEEDRRPPRE